MSACAVLIGLVSGATTDFELTSYLGLVVLLIVARGAYGYG